MALTRVVHFQWRLRVNTPREGWRARLAWHLRAWAQRLDGCASLGVDIESVPAIDSQARREVVRAGLEAMQAGLLVQERLAAEEELLRVTRPDLYVDEKR